MRFAAKVFSLLMLGFFLTILIYGQAGHGKGKLLGTVVDEDGSPIASARILLSLIESGVNAGFGRHPTPTEESAIFETVTDKKGIWIYAGLATGTWEVRASKAGYESASRRISVLQLSNNPSVKLRLNKVILDSGAFDTAPELLEQADEFYSLNKFSEALALYRQYIGKDPDSLMVMLAIGDCLRELGRMEEAATIFHAVIDKTSSAQNDKEIHARALTELGQVYFRNNEIEEAIRYWLIAAEESDLNEIPALNLAEVFFSRGDTREAIRYYIRATEISPEQPELHYRLGLAYLNIGNYEKARQRFAKVVDLQPRSELARQAKKMIDDIKRNLK